MALEKAPVSIRALTGKEKWSGTENEVRGLEDRTLMKLKGVQLGIIGILEVWALCGLPSCFDRCSTGCHHFVVSMIVAFG